MICLILILSQCLGFVSFMHFLVIVNPEERRKFSLNNEI